MRTLLLLLLLAGCSKEAPKAPLPPMVTVTQPEVKDVPLYYEYVGHVEANISVNLKAQVTGILTGQYFVEGQEVKEKDLLLTIDPRPFEADLQKAEAELAYNLASWRQAKEVAERNAPLVQQEYISQLDFDQFVTNVYTTEAAVKQSEADVSNAKINLDYCYIHAPISGVTGLLKVDVGNYVEVGGADPLLIINQISPVRVSFYVPEKDLPRIAELHQKNALKTIVYLQGNPIEGALSLIDNKVDENTGSILLQAKFPNGDKKLWPGEFVDVRLILETQKDAVLIPSQAVQVGQEGHYVFVMKPNSTVEQRNVTVGQKENEMSIIEKGLSPNETVVLEGQLNLIPGIEVAVKKSTQPLRAASPPENG